MVNHFDVATLREQDRFQSWHDVICQLFPRAAGTRGDDLPFLPTLERRALGSVEVSEIRCNALRYERHRHDQRLDQSEDFLVSLMLDGRARLEQDRRVAVQAPGDFVIYDAAKPFVYDFPETYRILLAKIPRRAMLSRLPDAERLTGVTVGSGDSEMGGLAASMMRSAAALTLPGTGTATAKVGLALVDILSAAIEIQLSDRDDLCNRQAGLLKRAKDHMLAHIDEPEMDVESIAQALHVSPRTLSRAFASEDTTVIRWLWKKRLDASYAALSEGRVTQVSDVALGCGFSSGTHFSRMFKATFGVLPHTLLRSPTQAH